MKPPDANQIAREQGLDALRDEIDVHQRNRATDVRSHSRGEVLHGAVWSRDAFTAAQLQKMSFPSIAWIIPNIIPAEGVTLLCSKPKFGKSWLAYDLCIACTMNRFTLGTIKPAQGDVLYLALEDSKRRLQRRMTKLLPASDAAWSERLTLKTEWRRLHEGGLDDIGAWHADVKRKGGKPILVAIDVLAKVRKPVGNRQLYEADYSALADLTKLANELGIAIVVVHPTRKMAADDLMETVSGSYGVSGAVDTILVMATKASGAVLDIRGRDVESAELAIGFDKNTCRWRVLGNAVEVHVSEQRAKIMAALKEPGEPMGIGALIEATSMKRNPLDVLLGRMAKEGEIRRVGTGTYAHKD
jgi:AAA domain